MIKHWKHFSLRSGTRQIPQNHDFFIQLCTGGLNHGNKGEKSIKCVRIEMEEAKLSLFAYNMLVHIEYLKV